MNNSTNPSALRSKKEICDALIRLMDQYPYSEITVKQIVLEAGVVRKTFYRNFTDKDDVLEALLNEFIREYTTEMHSALDRSWVEVIFNFCVKNSHFAELLDRNDMLYLVLNKLNTVLPKMHDEADAMGVIPEEIFGDLDMTYIIPFNTGAMWNVVATWLHRGMRDDPKKIAADLRAYAIRLGNIATKRAAQRGAAAAPAEQSTVNGGNA
ncbi:MAG: TetR/AcrR family transcriptional regulator [Lachnospiraceae bacterium]|nr:TetR/AcrR family transcriptional regulator [Lachnospiraceae bacterium]